MTSRQKVPPEKAELRRQLRQQRGDLPDATRSACAEAISDLLPKLPGWAHCRHTALYIDSDGEVPTDRLAQRCRAAGQVLWLPRILGPGTMEFARWQDGEALIENQYGIPEPGPDAPALGSEALDLLLTPLVAWDRSGNRLGMGGGYFDRWLAFAGETGDQSPLRVGIAYGFQEQDDLPRDSWDMALDGVLTERELVAFRLSPD
ncbi:MAG: 5-formyltetrahydrofolate cyclo-ligase [Pseudomonadota bacterium]